MNRIILSYLREKFSLFKLIVTISEQTILLVQNGFKYLLLFRNHEFSSPWKEYYLVLNNMISFVSHLSYRTKPRKS